MSARAGMSELINELRGLCGAGTADFSVGGVTYWTDDQLQAVLDQYRRDTKRVPLLASPVQVDGETHYYDYYIPEVYGTKWERATGGTAVWRVADSAGATQGTASYTVDYDGLKISFAADTSGSAYYLDGRSYDMNRAAAAVWRRKAAYYAESVDWATDGHRVNASQAVAHCVRMADEFEMKAGPGSTRMVRSDVRRR